MHKLEQWFLTSFRVRNPFKHLMKALDPLSQEYSHKHNFSCNVCNVHYLLRFHCLIHEIHKVLLKHNLFYAKSNVDIYLKPIHGPQLKNL